MTNYAMGSIFRYLIAATLVATFTLGAQAQNTKKTAKQAPAKSAMASPSTVLATVGFELIVLSDVERAFQKNLSRRDTRLSDVPRDTAMEFLRLYTNYRLKVQDAKDRAVDQDPTVKSELASNRRLLAETFFFDKAVADSRVDELVKRRLRELQIGIILCAIPDMVTKQWDTAASRAKAIQLVRMLANGADFEKLAKDSSDDRETGNNGGILPWITGGSIIKSVEDEAYSLRLGQVSPTPVGSRFGYFIVKLIREVPRETVRFRHILITTKEGLDSNAAVRRADSILAILKMKPAAQVVALRARNIEIKDDVFSDLARVYSDDKASATKGGYLGSPYSRSGGMDQNNTRLVPAFEEAIFALTDGQISDKVKTMFGIHIIVRDSTKKPDVFTERDAAKRTYRRLYFEEDKRAVLDSVKRVYGYSWNEPVVNQLLMSIDTTKNTQDTTWHKTVSASLLQQNIYTMPRGPLNVSDFVDSLRLRVEMRGYTLNRAGFERAINKMSDPVVIEQATQNLEATYQDFAALMQEFNDGILLFKVEEKEVWSKLRFDTTDARAFYDSTKTRWMTDEKFKLSEIFVLSDSLSIVIEKRIKAGEDFGDLAAAFTQRDGGRDNRGSIGSGSPKSSLLGQKFTSTSKPGTVVGPFRNETGYSFVRFDGLVPKQQKPFEDALTELAPAYQDALQKRLTEEWLSVVRQRHPVQLSGPAIDGIWGKTASSPKKSGSAK